MWATPVTVDSSGSVGQYTSLTLNISGFPIVSYYNVTSGDLKFVRSLDLDGNTWSVPVTIDSSGTVGLYTSLTLNISGFPIVSYCNSTDSDLKFARSNDLSGSTWTTMVIDSSGLFGMFTSLALNVSGFPIISYYDGTPNLDLKFAISPTLDGSGTWTRFTIDSSGTVGQYPSLTLNVSGFPIISYYDNTNFDLKFAISPTLTGSGTWSNFTIDSVGNVGQYTSLTLDFSGFPIISYYDATNIDLKFAKSPTLDGSGTWTVVTIDSCGNVGFYSSLALNISGIPIIGYYAAVIADLKFARPTESQQICWTSQVTNN